MFFKYAKMGEVQTGGKTFSMLCVSTKDLDASPIRRTIDANRIKRLVFDKNSSIAGYYFGTFYYAELEPSEEKGILYGFWAKDVEKLGEELGIPYDKLG